MESCNGDLAKTFFWGHYKMDTLDSQFHSYSDSGKNCDWLQLYQQPAQTARHVQIAYKKALERRRYGKMSEVLYSDLYF